METTFRGMHAKRKDRCRCGRFTTIDFENEHIKRVNCGCSGSGTGKTTIMK